MKYEIDANGMLVIDNPYVYSWLNLSGCTGLTSLPDGLIVDGEIYGCNKTRFI